jgi:hypothetical protein
MLVTGGILAAALVVVGGLTWWLLSRQSTESGRSLAIAAVAMWATSMAVVWWRHDEPPVRSALVQPFDSLGWPGTKAAPTPPPAATRSGGAVQAASVESLVGGLEARLTAEPADAEGWVLLAQSYAYTANEEAVERAVQRAVALGVDEQQLRERVANAQRSAPVVDWIDRAIGSQRR